MMDEPLDARSQEIFDSVPPEEPRSCLEPYRALILRLHNRGRTYRRIQQILSEKCGITVAHSTLYEFVQRRSRPRRSVEVESVMSGGVDPGRQPEPVMTQLAALPTPEQQNKIVGTSECIRRQRAELVAQRDAIRAAHNQPVAPQPETEQVFIFDPNKPLVNKNYGG